jgi:hypothetical protein
MTTPLAVLVLALLARGVPAETIVTPRGPAEVYSRGGQFDLVELLRLTGADVQFAPAAGGYASCLVNESCSSPREAAWPWSTAG